MISVENLVKSYGHTTAVNNLSFTLSQGKVTGFLGPNGSGKSTTMRCIVGLDRPTSGRCTIGGVEYGQLKSPLTSVGALLDGKAFHPKRTARQQLRVVARTHGIPDKRVDDVLEMTGIAQVADKRLKGFSLGMGQRLGIANALLGDPEVLLFDEPVNGLDPDGVRWVRDLMRDLAAQGRTVLVSSHLMSEMSVTADELVVIGRGALIASGPIKNFTESATHTVVHVAGPELAAMAEALGNAGLSGVRRDPSADYPNGVLDIRAADRAQIGHILHEANLEIHELSDSHSSLEDVYMELTQSSVEYGIGAPVPGLGNAPYPQQGAPQPGIASMPPQGMPPQGISPQGTYPQPPAANQGGAR
ncbi:MAG: ATP-binding cassette domain-containing protein [Ancrocorticia sp.]|uniref:ATP-binding cassette domain-containing protein n=1 Tax=Ancrocorticia sp. TaxID=2593684 RepID=UPI003F9014C0